MQIIGLVAHLVDGGLSILQYAYNIIIFMDHDIEKAKTIKMFLCINFHNGEIFCFGQAKENET